MCADFSMELFLLGFRADELSSGEYAPACFRLRHVLSVSR